MVNWQLSTPDRTLNSSASSMSAAEVNSLTPINLGNRYGQDLDGNPAQRLRDFYNAQCTP